MSSRQMQLAQNSDQHAHEAETETTAGHDSHGHGQEEGALEPGQVFTKLLGDLGDHYGIVLGPYHVADLPFILYDADLGFNVYFNAASLEAGGKYTMHDHHPVRADNHQKAALDLSITNFVFFEWLAMFILLAVFKVVGNRYKKEPLKAPRGIQNAMEALVVYLRDDVVIPNIPGRKRALSLLPYFLSTFFFILMCNLFGLIPGGHVATSGIGVTAALAIIAFFVINITALRANGLKNYLHHFLGGAPPFMALIMIPVEIISLFAKPFALAVRLFANMTAGHVVLISLIGLIFYFQNLAVGPVSVAFSVFVYCIELLVVFLQAYIFTTLTAVFAGLAIGDHGHEGHEEGAHA